ncbi:hypothetical protein NEIRO02_2594, partial [Nematocida sp. AWRm79]
LYPRQQEWQTASQTPLISKYYTLMEVRRGDIAIQDAMIVIGENFGEIILLGRNLLPKLCVELVKTGPAIHDRLEAGEEIDLAYASTPVK